jgi:D-apionolactonase
MTKPLKAGNLNLLYQDGFLRYLKFGEHEVVRMIYHAVRDHNWDTVPMTISNETISNTKDSFQISYDARFQQDEIDFKLHCQIIGTADSEISFVYEGIARSSFRRNRIGFLILHPIASCAGQPLKIRHTDGKYSETHFPKQISPHQPFMDIREMTWPIGSVGLAKLALEGDAFESEDQRNWTDASYKTYSTPLDIPFPVLISKGQEIKQKVKLKVSGKPSSGASDRPSAPTISLKNTVAFPAIGTCIQDEWDEEAAMLIKNAGVSFFRVEMNLDQDIKNTLHLLRSCQRVGLAVELAVFSDQASFADKIASLKAQLGAVKRILLLPDSEKTTHPSVTKLVPQLRQLLPGVEIFAGTDAFFTELNRFPVDASQLDGVSYSINPQVHAFDDTSLIETLEAQSYTVTSAKTIFPEKKISLSPVTFHMRWNPNTTDPSIPPRQPTGWSDKRQFTFFGACWWLISLKYLAESEVNSICFFDLIGKNGWMKKAKGTGDPYTTSPALNVLTSVMAYKDGRIRMSESSEPLLVDAIVIEISGKSICLAVNWSSSEMLTQFPEGFFPVRFSVSSDDDTGPFEWKPWEERSDSMIKLPAKSLTQLEKKRP